MRKLVFVTEGLIDLRAFTTFGVNAKPNTDNPIGYFGTGLKYAVAVLCRLGGAVTVFVGGEEHEFYSKGTDFRGKEFHLVRMKKRKGFAAKWRYEQLPFTTEFGKNWEPWQVYRELESNTRDENGETHVIDDTSPTDRARLENWCADKGKTVIVVTDEQVLEAHFNRDQIFLPDALMVREDSRAVQVFNNPSQHLYFRGLRVMDLPKPSAFTYNIVCDLDLTEDRTVKYVYIAMIHIRSHVMQSADEEFIRTILELDEEKHWEAKIDFDDAYESAGPTFLGVVRQQMDNERPLLSRARTYYERYYPSVPTDDPDITITMPRSKWRMAYRVLDQVDLYQMAEVLGWEEEDDRFASFVDLRDEIFSKKGTEESDTAIADPEPATQSREEDPDDEIPF